MKLTPELKAQIDEYFDNTPIEEIIDSLKKRGVVLENIDKPKSKTQLTFTKINDVVIDISFNNCDLGKLCCMEDGFFYWYPPKFDGDGLIDTWILKQIYEYADELNRPWNEEINVYFQKQKELHFPDSIEIEGF